MTPKISPVPRLRRRSLLIAAPSFVMQFASPFVLTGCATPSAPPPTKSARQLALTDIGFTETADGLELNVATRLMFPFDDATLSTDDLDALTHVSRILLGVGITRLAVEGHTDNLGGDEHNRLLSARRARTVADALVARGFAMSDITQRGFGASRPIADNSTELGRLHNRRAALIVPSI